MPKILYRWEQALVSILSQAQAKDWDILALSPRQVSKITTRGLLLLGIILLWWWNWKLLLATFVGIVVMLIVYTFKKQHWQRFFRRCQGLLTGYNRKLAFAVGTGGLGAFITYLTASIWADSENRWLATGSILQGFVTLITLFLLGWHFNRDRNGETKFNELLLELTAVDPLKRLIVIRQLTNLGKKNRLSREQLLQLVEYFYLMLAQPQESIISEALLDSLESFGFSQPEANSIKIPLELGQKTPVIHKID
ncbi:MAG: ATP synthase subunit I [Cyanobacteria bacterium P01_F01_bin.143]